MVHHRINDPDVKPNPHINFISALPNHRNPEDSQNAVEYLRALAAQVKPIMKAHGFAVNSLEEYEHNSVFLGRNWNNGETIELVLRNASGRFMPSHCLMSTLCHELAHILHMNHGPDFQALWRQLNREVIALQNKGYYGDGFWSSGTRLADSGRVGGSGIEPGDLPEYICGGAQRTSRPVRPRGPRGPRRKTVPSNHTGRQTEIPRKAGTRVRSAYSFTGKGEAVDADDAVHGVGTGFGKRAQSNRAREERALAAERRIAALQRQKQEDESKDLPAGSESESDIEQAEIPETDQERRQTLLDSMNSEGENMESMKLSGKGLEDFEMDSKNFVFAPEKPGESSTGRKQDSLPRNTDGRSSGLQADRKGKRKATDNTGDELSTPFTKRAKQPSATPKGRIQTVSTQTRPSGSRSSTITLKPPPTASRRKDPKSKSASGLANLVQSEVKIRKAEALGMEPGYTLGASDTPGSSTGHDPREDDNGDEDDGREWSCHICTLLNEPQHLACSACATPRRWNIK